MENKKSKMTISKETGEDNEKVILSKRTDTEDITKTIEKISNGYLLTVEIWNFKENMKSKNMKKFFEKNPLEMDEENEEEDSEDSSENSKMKGTSEFMENWNILEIK
jgi:hypothetical protein